VRAVVQRVSSARVRVAHEVVGEIGIGLLVLLGVARADGPADIAYLAAKIRDLRIFSDENGRMNRSVADVGGGVLLVSQFTLYADCRKGRRPSFEDAAPPAMAVALYEDTVRALRELQLPVATGVFQADMQVELVNDGPVTVLLESSRAF